MDGDAEGFALEIPESEVEGSDGVGFLAAGGIEEAAEHQLPEVLDTGGVLANQLSGNLADEVRGAAFANPGQAGIGFNGDDVKTLVDHRAGDGGFVIANAGNLHSFELGLGLLDEGKGEGGGARKEVTA